MQILASLVNTAQLIHISQIYLDRTKYRAGVLIKSVGGPIGNYLAKYCSAKVAEIVEPGVSLANDGSAADITQFQYCSSVCFC